MEQWTIEQAAEALYVDRKRIYDWVKRRQIRPSGIDPEGRFIYPEEELLKAESVRRVPARWGSLLTQARLMQLV